MPNWQKVAMDLGTGAVGGVASKLAEDWDMDREVKAGTKLEFFSRAETFVDYGIGILGIVGSFAGFLRGDWETRVLTMGGTLAGRRGTGDIKEQMKAIDQKRAPGVREMYRWTPAPAGGTPPPGPGAGPGVGARWTPQPVSVAS